MSVNELGTHPYNLCSTRIFWKFSAPIFMSGIIAFIQLSHHKIFMVLFIISCLINLKVTFYSRIPKGLYSNLAQFCHMSISFLRHAVSNLVSVLAEAWFIHYGLHSDFDCFSTVVVVVGETHCYLVKTSFDSKLLFWASY
jgi:hypothetical protein